MTKPVQAKKIGKTVTASEREIAALPGFDAAMRQIAGVSKEELCRREQAERDTAAKKS